MPLASNQIQIAQIASPGTTIVLSPARQIRPRNVSEKIGRDINGALYSRDVPYLGPDEIEVEYYITSLSQEDLNNLWDLHYLRERVRVTDGANTASPDKTSDPYFRTYDGVIVEMPPDNHSPRKQGGGPYTIRILVDTVTRTTMP